MAFVDDEMKAALQAQYDPSGTLHLRDLLALYIADFPDYIGMGRAAFLRAELDALSVTYSPTAHLADLEALYWPNVTFGPATPDGLSINTAGDSLLLNTAGDLLLRD